jgi:hypothetical protein
MWGMGTFGLAVLPTAGAQLIKLVIGQLLWFITVHWLATGTAHFLKDDLGKEFMTFIYAVASIEKDMWKSNMEDPRTVLINLRAECNKRLSSKYWASWTSLSAWWWCLMLGAPWWAANLFFWWLVPTIWVVVAVIVAIVLVVLQLMKLVLLCLWVLSLIAWGIWVIIRFLSPPLPQFCENLKWFFEGCKRFFGRCRGCAGGTGATDV